jgi:hypothetical protein
MSSIDTCRMFVKGQGSSKDREGTVRSMIVDIDHLYTMVYQHVKDCPTCEPDDVLRQYIKNRGIHKFKFKGGAVSRLLCSLAKKYARLKNKKVDPAILREFEWRSGNFLELISSRSLLPSEVVKGLDICFKIEKHKSKEFDPLDKFFAVQYAEKQMGKIFHQNLRFPTIIMEAARCFDKYGSIHPEDRELSDIVSVADVLVA